MAAAALPAKEAKGKSMKASIWRGCYLTVAVIAMWAWVDVAPTGAQPGPDGVHVQPPAKAAWNELLQRSPFPYIMPLPEPRPTAVDGTYTKSVVAHAERVHCLRCPDYAPEGGLWRIHFDKGTFRIIHAETAWKSIGTFIVAGDRLLLANDPNCIDTVGLYTWRLTGGLAFPRGDRRSVCDQTAWAEPDPAALASLPPAHHRGRHHRALAEAGRV